jgi:hypothetical protein
MKTKSVALTSFWSVFLVLWRRFEFSNRMHAGINVSIFPAKLH